MQPKYQIGQRFKTRGKYPHLCTVVDIYTTYNSKSEPVKQRYVAQFELLGQTVTDYDVVETTIAMGAI